MNTDLNLQVGKTYKFTHIRKGVFTAQLNNVVPGDDVDPQLLCVKIDTRKGSGQHRLARSKAEVTVTNIRPSLITHVELQPDDAWFLNASVEEERQTQRQIEDRENNRLVRDISTSVAAILIKQQPPTLFEKWRKRFF